MAFALPLESFVGQCGSLCADAAATTDHYGTEGLLVDEIECIVKRGFLCKIKVAFVVNVDNFGINKTNLSSPRTDLRGVIVGNSADPSASAVKVDNLGINKTN